MYLLPYVILKIILLTSTVGEPVLEILLPAENGQTLTNVSPSNSANDDEKTLSQQIFEGKYGLIHKELFNDLPSRPGILSYNINPEVPKDNINNLGGLDPDEIWLAENHLLVLRGGNFSDKKVKWSYIDNYIAPLRQVKIPDNPKIPPPFPIQLEDNGPIDFVPVNDSTWNPIFPPFPSIQGPTSNTTFDEDDQSLFYPPKYDFVYAQENSTRVPPGPLVPGIVLPPPPNFFGPLEKPEKAKKINLNTNKTIPRFNQKPYFKIPKGNHNAKEIGWVPIPSNKPNYIEGLKIKNNILITTTENNNYHINYNEQNNHPSQFFLENPDGHTTSQPDSYYYDEDKNKYDIEKPAQHSKYVASEGINQQFDYQNNQEKTTTIKPYYEYSYVVPEYDIKSQIQNPIHKHKSMKEYQKERPVYQDMSEKPKQSNYNNQMIKQTYQSWPQQNNQYSDIDYGYQTENPNFATDNPYHAFFTQDDASLVDENTKKYFALFGQKVRTEKPAHVTPQSKHHNNKNNDKMSLIDDILVNFKQPLPNNNPESEITTTKSYNNYYPQTSLDGNINVNNFKQLLSQKNPDAEISQNTNDFKENYPYSLDNAAINNRPTPSKMFNIDQVVKKPHIIQSSFQGNNPINYKRPLQSKNSNREPITQRPYLNIPQSSLLDDYTQVNYKYPLPPININAEIITQRSPYIIQSLFDDTNVNYKQTLETENPNAKQITQRPYIHVTQSPSHEDINYNLDSFVTNNPNSERVTQKSQKISQTETSFYSETAMNNKHPYPTKNPNIELVTQRPYINVPETSILDGNRVNYKSHRYSNSDIVTERPYLKVPHNSFLEDTQVNYQQTILQQNPNIEAVAKGPRIKFPQTSTIDGTRLNLKRLQPLRNHNTEYFTQRPQSIYPQTPVPLIDDIQVNYKQPLPTKNTDPEYIVSTQRPLNHLVSYNLPGNSGSHFFFLTTHTGHPIQYNLGNHNYEYYKRNVK